MCGSYEQPLSNQELMERAGVNVVHIAPDTANSFRPKGRKGVTVAFKQAAPGLNIELAVAVCNPEDTFTKKIGTRVAVANFIAGKRVFLPDNRGEGAVLALRRAFGA